MIAHGVRHARSLAGTARWFGGIGFEQPELQAKASAVVEIGSGAALIVGAGTPLAAAAVIGTMGVAARSVHVDNGFFVVSEGYEYVMTLAAASVALAAMGPSPFSVDRRIGPFKNRSGPGVGLFSLVLGLAGAAGQLAMFWRKPVPKA
jgi:putative oxidoreductase